MNSPSCKEWTPNLTQFCTFKTIRKESSSMNRISTFVILVGLCAMFAACRTQAVNPGAGDSTLTSAIDGLVLKGPISPVSRIGVPNTAPLPGAPITITNSSGSFSAHVVSDTAGKFYLKVAPGTYLCTPDSIPGQSLPRPSSPVTSVVPANTTVYDTLNYDTGIR
jgi:hypothetical protein